MRILAVVLLSTLAACSSAPPPSKPAPSKIDNLPPLLSATQAPDSIQIPKISPVPPMSLSSGDLIHMSVFRQKDMELEARVPETGEITVPLIGEVKVAGRTTREVQAEIKKRLDAKYFKNAGVTLTVVQYAPRMIYVLGGVQKPGGYEYPANRRFTVLQLVSAAGGYSDRAAKEFAQLLRRKENGERELFRFSLADVEKAVAKGALEADLEVGPDDLLVVPSVARVVYVLGQVNTPRNIDMPTDARLTVSMAVSQAGSWTKFAAISRIIVLRQVPGAEFTRFTVDLDEIVNGRVEKDLELLPGDVVWVPQRSIF